MRQQVEQHVFTGMLTDLAPSRHPANYLYDAFNIRITAREDDNLLSITNERGPLQCIHGTDIKTTFTGTYLGHCVLNLYIVIFSKHLDSDTDYISVFNMATPKAGIVILYSGKLGFDIAHPIETIASYENDNILKVYWTDGINQPRVINIVGSIKEKNDDQFNFVRSLQLNEELIIKKLVGASGLFAPGVILYAITYYDKFGQESNIAIISPLLYISHKDRGGSPEDRIDNAFKITITGVDKNFDYLRIYSILRTSLDNTPLCKKVLDIYLPDLPGDTATFTDTGNIGSLVDPTELLYKGGEVITAGTIELKDGTLFLGDLHIARSNLLEYKNTIKNNTSFESSTRTIASVLSSSRPYEYANQLNAFDITLSSNKSVPCSGFKYGDYYRCGVLFLHKTGRWSDPIWIGDYLVSTKPSGSGATIGLPIIKATISDSNYLFNNLYLKGYIKARPVVVLPKLQDRVVLVLGVVNNTLYTLRLRDKSSSYALSSWFFRPYVSENTGRDLYGTYVPPQTINYIDTDAAGYDLVNNYNSAEILGEYDSDNKFKTDDSIINIYSPDIEFNEASDSLEFINSTFRIVGLINFLNTLSYYVGFTSTPTINGTASGFITQSFTRPGSRGIIGGLYYDDAVVDMMEIDDNLSFVSFKKMPTTARWLIYPWQASGSLNNDVNRPANLGVRSALLSKKVLSNLRVSYTSYYYTNSQTYKFIDDPLVFIGGVQQILKFKPNSSSEGQIYHGIIDTLIVPDHASRNYFSYNSASITQPGTPYSNTVNWRTALITINDVPNTYVTHHNGEGWEVDTSHPLQKDVGEEKSIAEIASKKESVRMKYRTTPHILGSTSISSWGNHLLNLTVNGSLPIIEIIAPTESASSRFGGTSSDALQSNLWIPCGEKVSFSGSSLSITLQFKYGDTYFLRWDCLKTLPYTLEDPNLIVEIGSFMLETRYNIDGRYDRNRGLIDNTNISSINFNLLNKVYSLLDNFFTYRILDKSFYDLNRFSNLITWTKEKHSGAEIDLWTNITLASTYDMDGSRGKITSLNLWNNELYCFQERGISNILYNSRVQIPTSDNVPIEITNSYKVDGYRYITDSTGCSNKWAISETLTGIYFIDSIDNQLMLINLQLLNITVPHNMMSWYREHLVLRLCYEDTFRDVYSIAKDEALCFSEILTEYTSRMSYGSLDTITSYYGTVFSIYKSSLYYMFLGEYNMFFGNFIPYYITAISNTNGRTDKVFTNIEYRSDVWDRKGTLIDINDTTQSVTFDTLEVWNEYQTGKDLLIKILDRPSSLKKKFRIWRANIPRASYGPPEIFINAFEKYIPDIPNFEAEMDINIPILLGKKTRDRIRNPWCYIKLSIEKKNTNKIVLHDLYVYYLE